MTINEEYAMEMLLGGHLQGREIGGGYINAFMWEAKITNPKRLDKWLLNNGYLRKPTAIETVSKSKVTELKELLSKSGLKVTGKKIELANRVLSILPEAELKKMMALDKRYFLSDKGLEHYYANIDLEYLHKNWRYGIELKLYFKYRQKDNLPQDFFKIAYFAMNEKIENGTLKIGKPNKITCFDYVNFSEICRKINLKEKAIRTILIALYLNTNLAEDTLVYNKDLIEFNGIKKICNNLNKTIIFNISILEQIVTLSDFYSEDIVDDIYTNIKLQYIVFEKSDFKNAVCDILNNAYFDSKPYMDIILKNYIKTANNILHNRMSFFRNIFKQYI